MKNKIFNSQRQGFTLIEIILIIVIVSIAIPALLILLGQGAKQGVNAEIQVSATELAQQLMEEIKSKCWDELKIVGTACTGTSIGGALGFNPPFETAGNPATYDDVDDYNDGVPNITVGGATYTRSVQVCYVNPPPPNDALNTCVAGPTDYKRIRVRVNNSIIGDVDLVTVVTNY